MQCIFLKSFEHNVGMDLGLFSWWNFDGPEDSVAMCQLSCCSLNIVQSFIPFSTCSRCYQIPGEWQRIPAPGPSSSLTGGGACGFSQVWTRAVDEKEDAKAAA